MGRFNTTKKNGQKKGRCTRMGVMGNNKVKTSETHKKGGWGILKVGGLMSWAIDLAGIRILELLDGGGSKKVYIRL